MNSGTQTRRAAYWLAALLALVPLGLAGCTGGDRGAAPAPSDGTSEPAKIPLADAHDGEVESERAKLTPEERALVDAQEWCAVSTNSRLGSMGPPLKLTVKDQPVFVCCKGCQKKALADPDKTLATVAELKARARVERDKK